MLNEEKKAIANLKTEYEKLIKEDNILFPLYKSDAKRLIDLIEKQSKEIEELNKENTRQHELIGNIHKKWEDKIKAKIAVLEKLQEEFPNNNEIRIKIIAYKELLEKE